MTIKVRVTRPVEGRVLIRLPYQPGGGNYETLKDICGSLTRPVYNRTSRLFEVSRKHFMTVLQGLVDHYGVVEVTLESRTITKCVESCWHARRQDPTDCVCSCCGLNHGTNSPLPSGVVAVLPDVGGLSITSTVTRLTKVVRKGDNLVRVIWLNTRQELFDLANEVN